MKHLILALAVALPGVLSTVAAAQAEQYLKFKWTAGQSLNCVSTQEMTREIGGGLLEDSKSSWTITYDTKREVTQVTDEGVATVKETYQRARVVAEEDGARREFDSAKRGDQPEREDPLIKPFAAFAGKSYEFDVNAEGRVLAVRGVQEILKDATPSAGGGLDAMLGGMMAAVITEDSIKESIEQSLRVVPTKPVKTGDTWGVERKIPVPALGAVTQKLSFTLARFEGARKRAVIEAAGSMDMGGGMLGIKVTKSTVKATHVFDMDLGQIVESKADQTTEAQMGEDDAMITIKLTQRATYKAKP